MVFARLAIFLALTVPAFAQISNPGVIYVNTAPAGNCAAGATLQVVISTGIIYSCQSGAWSPVSGGSGGDGTVTHTTGALTNGFMTIGNGGADIKASPVDYGDTNPNSLTVSGNVIVNGGAATGVDGLILQLKSSNADQTGNAFVNTSSGTAYSQLVTGSNSAVQGFVYANDVNGSISPLFSSADATHPTVAITSLGVYGWSISSTDPTASVSDTGFSRDSAGVVDIGNGTAGDVSGGMNAARISASHFVASGTTPTIAFGTGAGTSPTATSITGGDAAFTVSFTTGLAPVISSPIFTVTFNTPFASAPNCSFSANNVNSALSSGVVYYQSTTTTFTLNTAPVAINASSPYVWSVLCTQQNR